MRSNPVKQTLAAGGTSVGIMLYEFATTGIMRILDAAGVEFAIFDLEHTGWGPDTVRNVMATSRATSPWPMVRVARPHYHLIAGSLDAGALGVMVPMVETAGEARLVVDAAKYPPAGRRGVGIVYPDDLSRGAAAWMVASNRETLVIAQVESVAGLESLDAITATDGIDVVWLGYYDLTTSMGIPGQFEHPDFLAAESRILSACKAHGKPAGIMVTSTAQARDAIEKGYRVVAFGDIWVFEQSLRASVEEIRRFAGSPRVS
jgi:2-keto-3-deoxy-L-rhamnonate aldolase RhmA